MNPRVEVLGMKALQASKKTDIPHELHWRLIELMDLSNSIRGDLEVVTNNASGMLLEVNLPPDQLNIERLNRDFKLSDVMLRRVHRNAKAYISDAYFLLDILAAPLERLYEE